VSPHVEFHFSTSPNKFQLFVEYPDITFGLYSFEATLTPGNKSAVSRLVLSKITSPCVKQMNIALNTNISKNISNLKFE
jgi:hypothetical protein